jgi:O-antigen/teichoic acid export membrane protein
VYFNELYVLSFIVMLCSGGLDYAVISIISRNPGSAIRLRNMLMIVLLIFVLVFSCFVLYGLSFLRREPIQPLYPIILLGTGNLMLIFYQGYLSVLKKFNLQNYLLIITNSLFLILLVFYNVRGDARDLNFISWTYAILFLVQGTLMYLFSLRVTQKKVPVIKVSWGMLFKNGILIMISSVIYFCFLRIDNFFVERYDSAVVLGNYVQCGKIGQYFLYFTSIISSTLLPFIASESIGSSYIEWKKIMKPYILLISAAALCIVLIL